MKNPRTIDYRFEGEKYKIILPQELREEQDFYRGLFAAGITMFIVSLLFSLAATYSGPENTWLAVLSAIFGCVVIPSLLVTAGYYQRDIFRQKVVYYVEKTDCPEVAKAKKLKEYWKKESES